MFNIDLRPVSKKINTFVSVVDKPVKEMSFYEKNILFCELSILSYFKLDEVRIYSKQIGNYDLYTIENNGGLAYIFENETDIILSVRGSDNKENLKTNFDFDLVKDGNLPGKVHHGFLKLTDNILDDFVQLIDENDADKSVWITGHSLGGAVAAILGVKAERRVGPNVNGIVTFGQPRIGTSNYIKHIKTSYIRWMNNHDIVTKLPMWLPHCGNLHYITENEIVKTGIVVPSILPLPTATAIKNHDIIEYNRLIQLNKNNDAPIATSFAAIFKRL